MCVCVCVWGERDVSIKCWILRSKVEHMTHKQETEKRYHQTDCFLLLCSGAETTILKTSIAWCGSHDKKPGGRRVSTRRKYSVLLSNTARYCSSEFHCKTDRTEITPFIISLVHLPSIPFRENQLCLCCRSVSGSPQRRTVRMGFLLTSSCTFRSYQL